MRAKFIFATKWKEARMSIGLKKIDSPVTAVEFRDWLTANGIWYTVEVMKTANSKKTRGIAYRMRLNENEKFLLKMRWM